MRSSIRLPKSCCSIVCWPSTGQRRRRRVICSGGPLSPGSKRSGRRIAPNVAGWYHPAILAPLILDRDKCAELKKRLIRFWHLCKKWPTDSRESAKKWLSSPNIFLGTRDAPGRNSSQSLSSLKIAFHSLPRRPMIKISDYLFTRLHQAGHTTGTRLVARSAFDGDTAREALEMQPVSA